jgi:hypothetical protein
VADTDRDGHPDFVIGRMAGASGAEATLYWFQYHSPDRWTQHVLGRESLSAVGAAALDVDGDGWPDIVCGGVWYRNSRRPAEKEFTRHVFGPRCAGAHDIAVADIYGDGKPEVVTMHDGPEGLCWYKIPKDPTQPWTRHVMGPGIHGGITPGAIADLDGDGDLDVLRADTWFENKDGKDEEWVAHNNVPFGRVGPSGMCVRGIIVDIDGDGRQEVVICDCDIVESKMAILHNVDGKGGVWQRQDLPQSFPYGSPHLLAVADFNGDGRLDILTNEQEELLPPGRKNPRWVIWENRGAGRLEERVILDEKLGGHDLQVADVTGDGRPDVLSKPWGVAPWNGAGGGMHVDFLENRTPRAAKG